MRWMSTFLPPFLLALLTIFTLGSVFQSQFVINDLLAAGIEVSFADRISLTIDDWMGLLPTYGALIGLGSLVIFLITEVFRKKFNVSQTSMRATLYGIAGMLTIALILFAAQPILDASLSKGFAELGSYLQLLSGLVGGALFGALYKPAVIQLD